MKRTSLVLSLLLLFAGGCGGPDLTLEEKIDAAHREYAKKDSGYMYKEGEGVRIDLVYALMWFILASSDGDEVADSEVQDLSNQLDKNQVKEAYGLVADCLVNRFAGC